MRVHKPEVEYKLAVQAKPQGSILTYYYKTHVVGPQLTSHSNADLGINYRSLLTCHIYMPFTLLSFLDGG